jgi:hypothetical protein
MRKIISQAGSVAEAEKNAFEVVRAMMLENLERCKARHKAEKAMRGFPGANEDQITTFKAYLERKVAANRGRSRP